MTLWDKIVTRVGFALYFQVIANSTYFLSTFIFFFFSSVTIPTIRVPWDASAVPRDHPISPWVL